MTIKESGRVLPYPSACLPRNTLTGKCGWPIHYRNVQPGCMVGYRPTRWLSKLLSLRDTINPVCASTWSNLLTGAKWSVLNQLRHGLPPSELLTWKHATLRLPIRYPPLSSNCTAQSHICATLQLLLINHIGPPSREMALSQAVFDHSSSTEKGPYHKWFPTTRLLPISYTTKHSHSNANLLS
jgi:hypothetical protein